MDHARGRVGELGKLGFGRCVLPKGNADALAKEGTSAGALELDPVRNVSEVLDRLFGT